MREQTNPPQVLTMTTPRNIFSIERFHASQNKVRERELRSVLELIESRMAGIAIASLERGPSVSVFSEDLISLDPATIEGVRRAYIAAGWGDVKYTTRSSLEQGQGVFEFFFAKPEPPSEYADSAEFTEDFETVKEILISVRWRAYLLGLNNVQVSNLAYALERSIIALDNRLDEVDQI